jgi:hypothetical protein
MHHTVGNILRTLLHANPSRDFQSAEQVVDYALATASHALRSTIHRMMGVSPGAVVFHRDMLMDIPYCRFANAMRKGKRRLIIICEEKTTRDEHTITKLEDSY